ncbi:MAG: LLM class flavin-dependent oxidoreductase, partial [Acidimicrobiia bacterium]|nr:LLM class flavin-dependent oxidoreductase [Acidimicrobiia bacterium]
MRLGICVRDRPATEVARLGCFAEDHGYDEVYIPDTRGAVADPAGRLSGRDAFVNLAAMFASTTRVRGAVGVAAVPFHLPGPLALTAASLAELSEGRFTLGIGISHAESARAAGVAFPSSPLAATREWLAAMKARSASGLAFGGGFPVVVGALGPKMVALGAAEGDGVVLNWLTPEHAARTVAEVAAAAAAGGPDHHALSVLYVR